MRMLVLAWSIGLAMAEPVKNCINMYSTDDHKVFFDHQSEVPGADAKSFVELHWRTPNGRCSYQAYGKDKNRVYFGVTSLKNANPNQFGILSERFAFSGPLIYFEGKLIPDADRGSFLVEKNGVWATDKNRFYCGAHPMEFASLTVFNENYVKDARTVCRGHELLRNADSATFQVKDGKARDKNGNL